MSTAVDMGTTTAALILTVTSTGSTVIGTSCSLRVAHSGVQRSLGPSFWAFPTTSCLITCNHVLHIFASQDTQLGHSHVLDMCSEEQHRYYSTLWYVFLHLPPSTPRLDLVQDVLVIRPRWLNTTTHSLIVLMRPLAR